VRAARYALAAVLWFGFLFSLIVVAL